MDYTRPYSVRIHGARMKIIIFLSNQTTHFSSKTYYDASICLTLTKSVISTFENLIEKHLDVLSEMTCDECGSRNIRAEDRANGKIGVICKVCDSDYSFEELIGVMK